MVFAPSEYFAIDGRLVLAPLDDEPVHARGMSIALWVVIMQHDVNGVWYNQHGSRVALQISEGAITGSFASSVGLEKPGTEAKVVGFVSGNLICFIANFAQYGSLTAWAGHITGAGDESVLTLQWHMTVALPGKEDPNELWRGVWAGSDVFRRQPASRRETPRQVTSHSAGSQSFPDWP